MQFSIRTKRTPQGQKSRPIKPPSMLGTAIQAACVEQFDLRGVPGALFHANLNLDTAGRNAALAAIRKRAGAKGGVPDTWGRGVDRPSGLWIEFKGSSESLTASQEIYIPALIELGERVEIVRGLTAALALLEAENILRGRAQ